MPALKGLYADPFNPTDYSSFARTSWTVPEGVREAQLMEARVFDVNFVNWTVNVNTIFDQRTYYDIQVSSPYLDPVGPAGIYVGPEVGTKCIVALPGDGSPPFVLAFIMPAITLEDTSSEEAPVGTAPSGGEKRGSGDFTYSGGRARMKPGDIVAQGRDGNFMVLHRGGVAQFGATPLAQRLCIPLGNLVTDIAQNYNLFTGGGTINWAVQDRSNEDPTSEWRQTVRVFANDEFADLRFAMGTVRSPVPEPTGDPGEDSSNNQLEIGTSEEVVFEMVLARGGFESDAGEFKGAAEDVRVRIFLDRAGNMMGRWEGSVNLRVKKRFRATVDKNLEVFCRENINVEADGTLRLIGKKGLEIGTGGGATTINGGGQPVAFVGSNVQSQVAPMTLMVVAVAPIPVVTPAGPGSIAPGTPLGYVQPGFIEGVVQTGNPTTLV